MSVEDLFAMAEREVVLAFASKGDGKSSTVARLVADAKEQGHNVVIIDRDNGLAQPMKEVFRRKIPDNVEYKLAKTWDDITEAMTLTMEWLERGDWLVFEGAQKLWDMAQSEYSRRVYEKSHVMHALDLRAAAEQRIAGMAAELDELSSEDERKMLYKIRQQDTGFNAFNGQQDWPWIKELHNDEVFDRAIVEGTFNVLTTASAEPLSEQDKNNKRFADYLYLGVKPGGEKGHDYRHSTVMYLYRKGGEFMWRTDMGGGVGKDRGYPLVKDQICTGMGAIAGLVAHHEAADEALYGEGE